MLQGLIKIFALKLILSVSVFLCFLLVWRGFNHPIQQGYVMPKIEIYSKEICPYCVRAKKLFNKKGFSFNEIDISNDSALRDLMIKRANGRQTVPQIFINDKHIGGCDDLYALESENKLDALLKDATNA